MTSTSTARIETPEYVIAAAAILRIASRVFAVAKAQDVNTPEQRISLGVWMTLRETAALLLSRGALKLNAEEGFALDFALRQVAATEDHAYIYGLTFDQRG